METSNRPRQYGSILIEKTLLTSVITLTLAMCAVLSWELMLLSFSAKKKMQKSTQKVQISQEERPQTIVQDYTQPNEKPLHSIEHASTTNNEEGIKNLWKEEAETKERTTIPSPKPAQIFQTKEAQIGTNNQSDDTRSHEEIYFVNKRRDFSIRKIIEEEQADKNLVELFDGNEEAQTTSSPRNQEEINQTAEEILGEQAHQQEQAQPQGHQATSQAEQKNIDITTQGQESQERLTEQESLAILKEIIEQINQGNEKNAARIISQNKERGLNPDAEDESGVRLIMRAISTQNAGLIRQILGLSPNLGVVDQYCNTPLTLAIKLGNQETISQLVQAGALPAGTTAQKLNQGPSALAASISAITAHNTPKEQQDAINNINQGLQIENCNKSNPPSPVEVATQRCAYGILEYLIHMGANPNQINTDGKTPLMKAAQLGCIRTVKTLIQNGASVELEDSSGRTALMWASISEQPEIIRLLIQNGADATKKDKNNISAIDIAFRKESSMSLKTIIETDWEFRLKSPYNSLHAAANKGQTDALMELLEKGEWVDQHDTKDQTPLMYAVFSGQKEAANILINRSANVNHVDKTEHTPLTIAAWHGNEEMVRLLLQNNANVNYQNKYGETALMKAIQGRNPKAVELLLIWGSIINIADTNGNTPLIMATQADNFKIVKHLIERGAFVNAKNKQGKTALTYAQTNSSARITNLLLDFGANINNKDANGNTPLMWMGDCKNPNIATTLIQRGGDASQRNHFGQTPIMFAATQQNPKLLNIFDKGKDEINQKDLHGRTPLMMAANAGLEKIVYALLHKKASINEQDVNGNTALMYSIMGGSPSCASMLIKNGAKTEIKNKRGQTALSIAKEREDFIKILSKQSKGQIIKQYLNGLVKKMAAKLEASSKAQAITMAAAIMLLLMARRFVRKTKLRLETKMAEAKTHPMSAASRST